MIRVTTASDPGGDNLDGTTASDPYRSLNRVRAEINVLFCPEEQHRASRETDIVPPVVRRDSEVNHALALHELAVADLKGPRLAAIATERSDHGILSGSGWRTGVREPEWPRSLLAA